MSARPTFYDWQDGIDVDAEMADWSQHSRRARLVVAVGFVIALVWLAAYARTGATDGVRYMAGVACFLGLIWFALAWFGRRRN